MKKIILKKTQLTRKKLENPFPNATLSERLSKSSAIDLTDNCTIEDLGNGYSITKIHDKTKLLQKI